MSEQDELDRLERQLDAAFAATRPRRGFEDELWARIKPPRRAPLAWLLTAPVLGTAGAAALVVLVVGIVVVSSGGGLRAGGGASTSGMSSRPTTGAIAGQAAPAGTPRAPAAALPFGSLPAPDGAGVAQVALDGRMSPLPAGVRMVVAESSLPQPAASIAVFRYDAGSGPPGGAILDPSSVPPGLPSRQYPSRSASSAFGEAADRSAGAGTTTAGQVTLTKARLVYVAVVAADQGYLEPAYLFTGTYQQDSAAAVPVQVLVPALAAIALR